jgi:LuxR family transcriptional regulator, maltose regulon positive regulatory protein
MDNSILATKLYLPILRDDVVRRGQLVERLNAGLWQKDGFVRKLTLVSAPAGFGKTTLASEWLRFFSPTLHPSGGFASKMDIPGVRVAWLSLDESDNDPVRFLAYLIASMRVIQAGFGTTTESILQLSQPPPPHIILTSLVNELASLPAPFILGLDDYHAIHTAPIHQQLAFILDNQPANMHLIVLTREDPLLPLARLRARGQLLDIRQEDLRFTIEETTVFLQRGTELTLNTDDISALERYTEGWPAGLQLAAASLRTSDDLAAFIRDFTTRDRYILDYLVEEVFAHQPVEVQDFLLQTSILKRLSGPLCNAVTGRDDSADVLQNLEKSNLFIVPLDLGHYWYRYHQLFAELLRHRLRVSVFTQANLHQRASRWYETQGFLFEAVDHSLEAQDWGNSARLIGVANQGMFKRGEVTTLLSWCARLPREVLHSSPELCLVLAWAALITSQFEVAAPALEKAEQMAPPGSHLLGRVASAQAFLARAKRDNAVTIQKSEQALSLLPGTDVETRGNIAMNLGLAYWHEGHLAEAEPVLVQACDLCSQTGNQYALLTAQLFLVKVAASRGKIHQAAEMAERLIRVGGQVPILCLAYYDLAVIHLEWNDLPKAWEYFEQGFVYSKRSGNLEFQQAGWLHRAILAHARGDEADARAALDQADQMAADFPALIRSRNAAFGVQLALESNDPTMLSHWSAQVKTQVDSHSFYRFMGLTLPRRLIAQGKKDEAAETLKAIYETASQFGWGYGSIVLRILQSLAAKTPDEAVQFISDALRMGQLEGFTRSFVEAGSDLIPLLQEAARRGVSPGYAGQIISALGAKRRHVEKSGQAGLVEPLSEREIEVLRLVTAGLSNREIAARLVISPGTAKTHIHNLCGKLGVRNRTEAAMRGKELGMV